MLWRSTTSEPEDENPYRASLAAVDWEAVPEPDPASSGLIGRVNTSRFLAANMDHAFAVVLFLVVGMNSANLLGNIGAGLTAISSYVGYYLFSEGLLGGTPGKLFFGLVVRQISGDRCTWAQIAIRTLLRFVEVNPLLFGALPAGIAVWSTKRRQRIGDWLAGTVVVQRTDLPGSEFSGPSIRITSNASRSR